MRSSSALIGALAIMVLCGWSPSSRAATPGCTSALGHPRVSAGPVDLGPDGSAAVTLKLLRGHTYLVEIEEHDIDLVAELFDPKHQVITRVDHPERRTGTQRALATAGSDSLTVRVAAQVLGSAGGSATVRGFDLAVLGDRPDCAAMFKTLAQADADYAAAEAVGRRQIVTPGLSAHDTFVRAADAYGVVERSLSSGADQMLRGQTQLALAGIEYFDLHDWKSAERWAGAAEATLKGGDSYRRARAEALEAASQIELGSYEADGDKLLTRARGTLRRLEHYHEERGEHYDAALQATNIGVAYLYQSRFAACVTASERASRMWEGVPDSVRAAQAAQNGGLCLWGVGRLAEAQSVFKRTLPRIGPEAYPTMYLASLTNTALLDYGIGHFDDSLRLFDEALAFANKVESPRDTGDCLYGIGMNYYALGDRERARGFLERALAIQTVAVNGHGRMYTLRALAEIQAEQGKPEAAMALDQEALALANVPHTRQLITIRLAAHTAAAGNPSAAVARLDQVAAGADSDGFVRTRARLDRAVVLRQMGKPRAALTDLLFVRPRLHALGSLAEEFDADLELARTYRALAEPRAAHAEVDRALRQVPALRLQTANPALRASLQAHLRAAYELKIELLRADYEAELSSGRAAASLATAADAFATADASRARTLADVAAQEYPLRIRTEMADEFRRREELYRDLAARRYTLESLLDQSGSAAANTQRLSTDIAELQRQVDSINTRIAARATPRGTGASGRQPVAKLPQVPEDTALVSYWLGTEAAYAWVSAGSGLHWVRLSAPPTVIAGKAIAMYHLLTRLVDVPVGPRLSAATDLYLQILRPLEPWVSGARQWVVIPDGALDYIPFAALRTADRDPAFVALKHDVALTPAAWRLEAASLPEHPERALLLVADPVYQPDDPRLGSTPGGHKGEAIAVRLSDPVRRDYRRLPYTAQEAAGIAAQFPAADVDRLTGTDATRERLLALDWSRYRFIHIATHGVVDPQVPELSALILGSYDARGELLDGAVRVADLSMRTLGAEVAVFSGCETALGKDVPSEGLVGIGSVVLARGARAVVASLWPVADEMGARLMTDFYRHLLHDSMSAQTALGASMRAVVSADRSADPALWAAYQVSVVAFGPGLPMHTAESANVSTTGPREKQ